VTDNQSEIPFEVPKWDVALAALVKEEFSKTGRGLTIEDFKRLATQHATRFDDIMVTVFELTLNGEWNYRETNGAVRRLARKEVNDLYVGGRIKEQDVAHFAGGWEPASPTPA
jgi:hypothetical protein